MIAEFDVPPASSPERLVPGEPVWVFGTGSFGRAVARACEAHGIPVAGFVQTQPTQAIVDGHPVCAWGERRPSDSLMPLLVGIFNRDTPLDGLVNLAREAGCRRIVLPWQLHEQFAQDLGWRYWLGAPEFLRSHAADLSRLHERLADDTSRKCLQRLVRFRMGLDLDYSCFTHPEPQYFNGLTLTTLSNKPLTYLDGGAYDGDSLCQLVAVTPAGLSHAWLFEPDTINYSKLVDTVRERGLPASCMPLALADCYQLLRFSSGLGEAGHVSQEGDNAIATVAIDDLLAGQPVDFIKLDVEGGEAAALHGARRSLDVHRPVLAISCYHKPEDLWVLPNLIDSLVPGYRMYFRQHTFNSFDLVLYAIPQ
jgi:FkbM family methyltransferase